MSRRPESSKKTKSPAGAAKPEMEPLFSAEAVRAGVASLGQRITAELGGEDPLLVALLGGSVIFLADLVRAIGQPVRYEFIHVGSEEESGVMQIQYPIPLDIAGQSVLVVKDVVASGVTEPYLEQQLRDRGARAVRFAALIDIPDDRKTGFEVSYSVFSTPRQGVLVGYGLKHGGRYGNLPYVARLAGGTE
jgi:hypoxanthine phosphoribosyltransferase